MMNEMENTASRTSRLDQAEESLWTQKTDALEKHRREKNDRFGKEIRKIVGFKDGIKKSKFMGHEHFISRRKSSIKKLKK